MPLAGTNSTRATDTIISYFDCLIDFLMHKQNEKK